MRKTLSKEALVTYVVNQYMDEETIDRPIDAAAKAPEAEHKQAVNELAELAISCGAARGRVGEMVDRINDKLTSVEVRVGDDLYFRGFIEGLKLMGYNFTMEDIREGIEKANKERARENLELYRKRELMIISARDLLSVLDTVSLSAVRETMVAMLEGNSTEAAVAAGNQILIAAGRTPVSYPVSVS